MTPKVSVIIPVYNMGRFLSDALKSITSQSLREIELICINDGSTDNSLAILREWSEKDSRIRVIDKQNEGVGKARNDGIAAATGQYLNFFDPDDLFPADDVLEVMYRTAEEFGVLAIAGTVQKIDGEGKVIPSSPNADAFGLDFSQKGKLRYADWQYDYGYQAFLFDTQTIKENGVLFPDLTRFQDPPFFVRALAAADEIYLLEEPTYSYRLWGQMKAPKPQKTADMIEGVVQNLTFAREKGFAKLYYLSALRLQREVSYVLLGQLEMDGIAPVLLQYCAAYAALDLTWLSDQGYDTVALATPDCLTEMLAVNRKYHRIRRNPILRALSKLVKRGG